MDEPYNAAERQHVKLATKAAKELERQRLEIIRGLMSLAPGRGWVLELLERCHIFSTSFDRNALSMAFSEGERNIGLRVLADIHAACPEQYLQMMREKNERDLSQSSNRKAPREPESFSDYREDGDRDHATEPTGETVQ